MDSLQLRLATPADVPMVLELFRGTVETVNAADYDPAQRAAWIGAGAAAQRWEKRIESQYFVLAMIESELVGFGSLTSCGHLDVLFVHQNHQRKGIAAAIYQAIESRAREQGFSAITSDVSLTAKPFFHRVGFAEINEQTVNINGILLTNFRMQKSLD